MNETILKDDIMDENTNKLEKSSVEKDSEPKHVPKKYTINHIINKNYDVSATETWAKMNKTNKIVKINFYIQKYAEKNNLNNEEIELLTIFLKDSLDKKKLNKIKDVNYDKLNGLIKDIPGLTYIKSRKHFTLRNMDKRVSTLKSLAPKKLTTQI